MGVHSGKFAVVNGQTAVRNWNVDDLSSPEQYVASNTAGGTFVNPGVSDWNGSFSGFGGTPPISIMPGSIFTFDGYTAPGNDVLGAVGNVITGSAIVESLTVEWNWQPSASLMWTCNFASALSGLVHSSGVFTDVSAVIPQRMCGLIIETGAAAAEVEWENLVSATFTFTSQNQTFVNSSTNCFTGRKPGNVNWTLDVTEQNELNTYAKGTDIRIRAYVSASTFWLLEWGHLQNYTGPLVDRETGAIIQKTANLVMSGSNGTVLGQVVHPGGTVIWPQTP